ncbi:hypothetical protein QWY28_17360 [Nocardioides sp. SOB77]|uniref:DUF3168 domain-containing protein n=1 Tax=Nocardioides oceani TaxID=3058369 RepID=A0ABT8FJ87_9ACTN|nr:hypothetical protein [Nocardioides oceani]MDN4174733.1 hypothetical protein [Nocardioides oceani]
MTAEVDDQVLALLRAVEHLNVHDGYVQDSDETDKVIHAALPYVVFYSTPGEPNEATRSVGSAPRGRIVEFQITFVGDSREQAKRAGQRAEDALDRQVVKIAGRDRRIRRTPDNVFVRRDDTWTGPDGLPLFFGATRFRIPT